MSELISERKAAPLRVTKQTRWSRIALSEKSIMASQTHETVISLMLAVPNTPTAVDWYKKALGARVLWSMGSVAGLEMDGAPFFLHEPVNNGFDSPQVIGATTVRVELFVADPD